MALVNVPITGGDGQLYPVAVDPAGGSVAGSNSGGGMIQLVNTARYATIITSSSGQGPTLWKPDGTDPAVRCMAVINASGAALQATLSLYDTTGSATPGARFFEMVLPAGSIPIVLGVPLSAGFTWALDAVLQAGQNIVLLAN